MISTILKSVSEIIKDHIQEREMLWRLSLNDFKARFANSYLGAVWAFVTPLVTMLVFWFVFQVGLRNSNVHDHPFIVWYAPAFLIWSFFAETWNATTNSFREYSFLVRKVNFRISIIPTIKVFSGIFVHLAFILFIVVLNLAYGIKPSIYYLQVLYYFPCAILLVFGLGLICGSIAPFVGDTLSIVSVILQVLFWATPIVWDYNTMDPWVQNILKANPMFYIIQGYRDTFIDQIWIWERGPLTLYFWAATLALLLIGAVLFKKLRPLFADVL